MKRRTILPCWCVRLVAGGETHEVVQTGVCNWVKAEARIRAYFIAAQSAYDRDRDEASRAHLDRLERLSENKP